MKGGMTILNIGSLDPNHMSPFFSENDSASGNRW